MIRKLLNGDIDRVADIWLKTNLKVNIILFPINTGKVL